jgi:hypothetical protein
LIHVFTSRYKKKTKRKKMKTVLILLCMLFLFVCAFVVSMLCLFGISDKFWFRGIQGNANVGAQGRYGQTGFPNTNGVQGFPGMQGYNAAAGMQGVVGSIGTQGFGGTDGQTGLDGVTGAQGYTSGLSGMQGMQGLDVGNGSRGVVGQSGTQGFFGAPMPIVFSTAFPDNQDLGYGPQITSLVQPLPLLVGSTLFSAADAPGDTYQLYLNGTFSISNATNVAPLITFMMTKNSIQVGAFVFNAPQITQGTSVVFNYALRFDITMIGSLSTRIDMTFVAHDSVFTLQPAIADDPFVRVASSAFQHANIDAPYTFDITGECSSGLGRNFSVQMVRVC